MGNQGPIFTAATIQSQFCPVINFRTHMTIPTRNSVMFAFSLICTLLMPVSARAVTVPSGTPLWVRTRDEVSSGDKAGKQFAARLDSDLIVKGKTLAPAGTKVYGRVESSRSAGRAFGKSELVLSLTQIVIGGRPVAIATGNYEGSGPRSGRKTVARTAAGAAIGAAFGGPAAGAAIGAATGLIGRGKAVVAPTGTLFEFRLSQPVSL
jgi:hypothetical protein